MKKIFVMLLIITILFVGCTKEEELHNGPNPNGPYSHKIYSASSADGLNWIMDEEPIIEHASVPDPIITNEGNIRVYYLNFDTNVRNESQRFSCIESSDNGKTFFDANCSLKISSEKAADPNVVKLDDGRYRLYYYALNRSDFVNSKDLHTFNSAISVDGINFVEEQTVFVYNGIVDPDVFWNGEKWIMTTFSIADSEVIIAESYDGLSFSYLRPTSLPGVITCQPVLLEDGSFRVYSFTQNEQDAFYSYISTDGLNWTIEKGIRLEASGDKITDPQVVQLSDGTWKMYFKLEEKDKLKE